MESILDCEAILCARIGSKMEEILRKNGLQPREASYLIIEA